MEPVIDDLFTLHYTGYSFFCNNLRWCESRIKLGIVVVSGSALSQRILVLKSKIRRKLGLNSKSQRQVDLCDFAERAGPKYSSLIAVEN